MTQIEPSKVVALVGMVNELIRRVGDYRVKEAQYEQHVDDLADETVEGLVELDLLSQDRADATRETLKKSAATAVDMLHTLVKHAKTQRQPVSIGTAYSPAGYGAPTVPAESAHTRPRFVEVDDLVIDVTKYL